MLQSPLVRENVLLDRLGERFRAGSVPIKGRQSSLEWVPYHVFRSAITSMAPNFLARYCVNEGITLTAVFWNTPQLLFPFLTFVARRLWTRNKLRWTHLAATVWFLSQVGDTDKGKYVNRYFLTKVAESTQYKWQRDCAPTSDSISNLVWNRHAHVLWLDNLVRLLRSASGAKRTLILKGPFICYLSRYAMKLFYRVTR